MRLPCWGGCHVRGLVAHTWWRLDADSHMLLCCGPLLQLGKLASDAGGKLGRMAQSFMRDLQGGY